MKQKSSQNFSRYSKNYHKLAKIQHLVAKKLIEFANPFLQEKLAKNSNNLPNMIDLGSGTGFVKQEFFNIFYNNIIANFYEVDLSLEMLKNNVNYELSNNLSIKINADIKKLPFKNNSFDVIFSSFALQWLEKYEVIFGNFAKMLRNYKDFQENGFLIIALPTAGSLKELKLANIASDCNFDFLIFPEKHNLLLNLEKAGFKPLFNYEQIIDQNFSIGTEALKSIKNIGANYANAGNIINKNKLKKFNQFLYKNFSYQEVGKLREIRVSWHINYFIASKKNSQHYKF
ncbi:MAG: methyltransferase domain-containing protein [Rickettsiales bacterium]|nr:methyltransferase domain-containing protein [Rickettsiales bacterium]